MLKILIAALGFGLPTTAALADAAAGHAVFSAKCAICHSATAGENHIGPSLDGVVGRVAGTEPGFAYSAAMKAYAKPWSAALLDPYLAAPQGVVPGTKMGFPGLPDAQKRGDLILYLATLK